MAPPKLYMIDLSPPVRAVLLTEKALGITLHHEIVSFTKGEQLALHFSKCSPHYTLPTLVDNGYFVWNSHSIIAYLIGKYGNDDTLYPKEHRTRAIVDQRLQFDSDVYYNILNILKPMLKLDVKTISKDKEDGLNEIYELANHFLVDHQWMAGDNLTIADLSLIPSVTSADILVPIDNIKYPNLCAWIKRSQALFYYQEANQIGLDNFKNLIKSLLN